MLFFYCFSKKKKKKKNWFPVFKQKKKNYLRNVFFRIEVYSTTSICDEFWLLQLCFFSLIFFLLVLLLLKKMEEEEIRGFILKRWLCISIIDDTMWIMSMDHWRSVHICICSFFKIFNGYLSNTNLMVVLKMFEDNDSDGYIRIRRSDDLMMLPWTLSMNQMGSFSSHGGMRQLLQFSSLDRWPWRSLNVIDDLMVGYKHHEDDLMIVQSHTCHVVGVKNGYDKVNVQISVKNSVNIFYESYSS